VHDDAAGLELGLRQRWLGPAESPARRGRRRIQYWRRRLGFRPWRKHACSTSRLFNDPTGVRLGVREWRLGTAGSSSGRAGSGSARRRGAGRRGAGSARRRGAGSARRNDRLRCRHEWVSDDTACVELGVCEWRMGASGSPARARRRKLVTRRDCSR
jgi:hypothetical protein